MQTSKTRASIGRVLLCFCPLLWTGAQPADVVSEPVFDPAEAGATPTNQRVDVCVKVNGVKNSEALRAFRDRLEGNTFADVPLFDALTDEQRAELAMNLDVTNADGTRKMAVWAEWMPYQVGQAQKNTDDVLALRRALHEGLLAHEDARGELARQLSDLRRAFEDHLSSLVTTPDKVGEAIAEIKDRLDALEQKLRLGDPEERELVIDVAKDDVLATITRLSARVEHLEAGTRFTPRPPRDEQAAAVSTKVEPS